MQNVPNPAYRLPTDVPVSRPEPVKPMGPRPGSQIDPHVWERPDMRRFLAARDIASVFRLLQRIGVSQRAIAARTGLAQSDVSAIVAGKRQVVSYDVLARIAQGLDISPGWMGLAFDESTATLVADQGGGA